MNDHDDDRSGAEAVRMARAAMSRRRFLGRAGAMFGGRRGGPRGACRLRIRATRSPAAVVVAAAKSVTISNWTGYMSDQSEEGLHPGHRHQAHLQRGHQRQQRVLRQDPAEPRQRPEHRHRRLRPHRLDGEPDDQPGEVGAAVRRREVPEQGEPASRAAASRVRSRPRKSSAPWASGVTGIAYNIEHRRARRSRRSTISSPSRAPRRSSSEMRDTVGPVHAGRRPGHHQAHLRRRASRRSTACRRPSTTARSTGSTATSTSNDLGSGTWRPRSRGPATSPRSPRTTRTCKFAVPESGGMLWSDNFMIPKTSDKADARDRVHQLLLRPEERGGAHRRDPVHLPGRRRRGGAHQDRRRRRQARRRSARRPDRRVPGAALDLRPAGRRRKRRSSTSGSPRSPAPAEPGDRTRRSGAQAGLAGAVAPPGARDRSSSFVFFFFPLYTLGPACRCRRAEPVRGSGVRLGVGELRQGVHAATASSSSARSCTRRSATLLALVIAYPLAYVIAFRGGRCKNLLLGLVVVPFFTNFLIRTLAWKTILGDQGTVVGFLRDLGILGPRRHACCARRSR